VSIPAPRRKAHISNVEVHDDNSQNDNFNDDNPHDDNSQDEKDANPHNQRAFK
jgi:hypothetical protein